MHKKYNFCEYVNRAISWKFDILLITTYLKIESKKSFAHVWQVSLLLSVVHDISFAHNQFSVKYDFSNAILSFLTVKSPSINLKSVSQENAINEQNPVGFSSQNYRI